MIQDNISLRKLLKNEIKRICTSESIPTFKILVLDEKTRDILTVLYKVSELTENYICSFYLLSANRPDSQEIPAVYYVSSFEEAVEDIYKLKNYSYYISSSNQLARRDLENLAVKLNSIKQGNRVIQIQDTFTEFVALQNDLFSLNIKDSFINSNINETVVGLFSVLTTINTSPVIVTNKDTNNSEVNEVFNLLSKKIKSTKLIKSTSFDKSLYILVDRELDLVSPCHHVMGYLEIIDDVFDIKLNKVTLNNNKSIDIDVDNEFFIKNRFEDFPNVVELVESEVHKYKKKMALSESKDADDISRLLENAPELQKNNELVNTHLTICTEAVKEIDERKLDDYYTMENNFNKDEISELTNYGTERDVIRLCISLIGTKNEDLIEPILEKRKINTKIVNFVKERTIRENTSFLTRGIRNILFNKQIPIISYIEDVISKVKSGSLDSNFNVCYQQSDIFWGEITIIVIFVMGGVSYFEFKKIKELEKKHNVQIIVGGTEILNPNQFLKQIEQLTFKK
ncbi:SLY1 [Hepatospora eriocheir]|uniref:SLY1 n=1 Tax=Hepatospora eriocheir TaxID=1081669 RepID=A0A1X0QBW5_9MICR|nr:SLY1 [Hepatospora eriocheir]